MVQQQDFPFKTTGVARQLTMAAHDSVAGNQNTDRILSYRLSHCLGRHFLLVQQSCRLPGKASIASDLSIGNRQKQIPDQFLKGGSLKGKRYVRIRLFSLEVGIQPQLHLLQNRMILLFAAVRQFPVKPDSRKAILFAGQKQFPQRGSILSSIHYFSSFLKQPQLLCCGCMIYRFSVLSTDS